MRRHRCRSVPLPAASCKAAAVSTRHFLPLVRFPKLRVAGSRRRSRKRMASFAGPRTRSRAPGFRSPVAVLRDGFFSLQTLRSAWCRGGAARWSSRADSMSVSTTGRIFSETGVLSSTMTRTSWLVSDPTHPPGEPPCAAFCSLCPSCCSPPRRGADRGP